MTSIITTSHFSNVLSDDAFAASRAFTVHRSTMLFRFQALHVLWREVFFWGLGPGDEHLFSACLWHFLSWFEVFRSQF